MPRATRSRAAAKEVAADPITVTSATTTTTTTKTKTTVTKTTTDMATRGKPTGSRRESQANDAKEEEGEKTATRGTTRSRAAAGRRKGENAEDERVREGGEKEDSQPQEQDEELVLVPESSLPVQESPEEQEGAAETSEKTNPPAQPQPAKPKRSNRGRLAPRKTAALETVVESSLSNRPSDAPPAAGDDNRQPETEVQVPATQEDGIAATVSTPATPRATRILIAESPSTTRSSNAENRIPSSPPIGESTPKASAYNIASANADAATAAAAAASAAPSRYRLDYSSEAGYTPPPDDAERPRLRPLEPRTLKPMEPQPLYDENDDEDTTPGFVIRPDSAAPGPGPITTISEDDTEEEPRLPSPTPKKMRSQPMKDPHEDVLRGKATEFYLPGEDEPFLIYSDPKSGTTATPEERHMTPLTGTQRPPDPYLGSSSPLGKRSSSVAGMDSEPEDEDPGSSDTETATTRPRRKSTRTKKKKEDTTLSTDKLRAVLPRRRRTGANARRGERAGKSLYDVVTDEDEDEDVETEVDDDEDELSRSAASRRRPSAARRKGQDKSTATATRKPTGKAAAAKKSASAAIAVTPAKSRTSTSRATPLRPPTTASRKTPARTYGSRKSEAHKQSQQKELDSDGSSVLSSPPPTSETTDSTATIVVGDGIIDRDGRRELKQIREKFKEVDEWEMEFEDVSVSAGSEGLG